MPKILRSKNFKQKFCHLVAEAETVEAETEEAEALRMEAEAIKKLPLPHSCLKVRVGCQDRLYMNSDANE